MQFKKLILALAAVAVAGLAQAQAAKFGYGASEDNSQGMAVKRFADLVKTKTSGRVTVNTYASGKLGTDAQMQSAVQGGTQELMVGPTANLVGIIKEYALLDLPFLVTNYKEADTLLDGPVGQALAQKLDAHGLVGLGYWENGFRHITNSRRVVNKLEDVAGLKIRVIPNPVYIETFKALGANPVPLPYTELYGALETRSVDAQENSLGLLESGKFYEVQKFLSMTGHIYTPYIVLASKKWFDKLSDADKAAVRAAAAEAVPYQRTVNRDATDKLKAQMVKHGLQVTDVSAAEINRMREKVKPVHEKFVPQIGAQLMEQANAEIAKAK